MRHDGRVASDTYHHGDLPNTLRRVAAELLAEEDVAGFSLREVARRAGVSHTAPAHHFGDAAGLLTAVATDGFEELTARTIEAAAGVDDPVEALVRVGRAYVRVATDHPGHCAGMFRKDMLRPDDPADQASSSAAFGVLSGAVQRVADERSPDLDVFGAAQLCWATMHGLLQLYPGMVKLGTLYGAPAVGIEDLAESFGRQLVAGFVPDQLVRTSPAS